MIGNKQTEKSKPIDLIVYYGNNLATDEPKESKYHLKFVNPTRPLLLPTIPVSTCETFIHEWIYLGLYSQTGCELTISVYGKEDDK